ncbi:transposase [Morococcus cerebrosus]|uniref:Transposase n=1 Tax=Morococcus cerebrosus TaxID=1056807 RepID=A0A0C1EL64_9NEIS|nr:transposase [Morococcus cerebrosus]
MDLKKRSSENRKYGFQTTFVVFGNYMFPLYNRGFSIQ